MKQSSKKVGWEDLPYEIQTEVISYIYDPGSLGALFHASPVAYRTFGDDARSLVEKIFASGYVCGHTAVLFRLCALIRTGRLPVSDTPSFRKRVTAEALLYQTRVRESKTGIAPRSLDHDIDPSIVRSLLVVARHASNLAWDCLSTCLERLKALRPQHPLEAETFDRYYYDCKLEWQPRPEGRFFEISVSDQLSWDEEQRAVRAVWRLQLIYELKRAVNAGIVEWTDTVLSSTKAFDLQSIQYQLSAFYGARDNYLQLVHDGGRGDYPSWYDTITDYLGYGPEFEEISAIIHFVRGKYGTHIAGRMRNGTLCVAEIRCVDNPQRFGEVLSPSKYDWKQLIFASAAVSFYNYRRRHRTWPRFTGDDGAFRPLVYTSFDDFADYGFAFWSYKRMADCGLLKAKRKENVNKFHYAWYSVLSEEDIRRIERLGRESAMADETI